MCNMTVVPGGGPPCDFTAATGRTITLTLQATAGPNRKTGAILFGETVYGTTQVVAEDGAVKQIQFPVQAGSQTISFVFYFSQGKDGRGKLIEQCPDGTQHVLDGLLTGDEPLVIYQICGA